MKYMVTAKPGMIPIPPEQAVALYKAAEAWTEERLKDGRIESTYVFPERGGFSIGNIDSHEELFAELMTYPLYPFFDWEVQVLCDWKESFQRVIEYFEKMAVL
jgi:muconolactone delta-isomerase